MAQAQEYATNQYAQAPRPMIQPQVQQQYAPQPQVQREPQFLRDWNPDHLNKYLDESDMSSLKKVALVTHFKQIMRENPNLPIGEFIYYLQAIQATNADPLKKQIFFTVKNDAKNGTSKGVAVISYHYFMAQALATGLLVSFTVRAEICKYLNPWTGVEIKTYKSIATVKRKGMEPMEYVAYLPEFAQGFANNQTGEFSPSGTWKTKPVLMLNKCALANAIRQSFEEVFAGIYTVEEMQSKFSEDIVQNDFTPSQEAEVEAAPAPAQEYQQAPYEQAPYEQAPYEQAPYEQKPAPIPPLARVEAVDTSAVDLEKLRKKKRALIKEVYKRWPELDNCGNLKDVIIARLTAFDDANVETATYMTSINDFSWFVPEEYYKEQQK